MSAEIFRVIASFQGSNGNPLTGADYAITLMDEDRFFDGKLDESALDAEGQANFMIVTADILSLDSMGERTPDLYFIVKQDGKEIFRTGVIPNVDFDVKDPVTGRTNAITRSFGPFRLSE